MIRNAGSTNPLKKQFQTSQNGVHVLFAIQLKRYSLLNISFDLQLIFTFPTWKKGYATLKNTSIEVIDFLSPHVAASCQFRVKINETRRRKKAACYVNLFCKVRTAGQN